MIKLQEVEMENRRKHILQQCQIAWVRGREYWGRQLGSHFYFCREVLEVLEVMKLVIKSERNWMGGEGMMAADAEVGW